MCLEADSRSGRWLIGADRLPFTSPLLPVPLGSRRGWVQAVGGGVWVAERVAGQGGGTVSGGQALEISVVCFRMGGVLSRRFGCIRGVAMGWLGFGRPPAAAGNPLV